MTIYIITRDNKINSALKLFVTKSTATKAVGTDEKTHELSTFNLNTEIDPDFHTFYTAKEEDYHAREEENEPFLQSISYVFRVYGISQKFPNFCLYDVDAMIVCIDTVDELNHFGFARYSKRMIVTSNPEVASRAPQYTATPCLNIRNIENGELLKTCITMLKLPFVKTDVQALIIADKKREQNASASPCLLL